MPQREFLHFSVSTVHVFSQLSLIQCYDLAGFGCLITCRGTSRQLLQRTEYVANSHHRLRVTYTLNPVPAHEFETECRCVSVGRNEQDDKESGKKRKARTLPTQKSSYFQLRNFQHKSLGQSVSSISDCPHHIEHQACNAAGRGTRQFNSVSGSGCRLYT